ncbi:hypothetical protein LINGRAHAP2_LOCUS1790 [Linum grandiflorum]
MNEPFVLASLVAQVFHVDDKKHKNWHIIVRVQPRNSYALSEEDLDNNEANEVFDVHK